MRIVVTDRAKSDGGGCQRHPLIRRRFSTVSRFTAGFDRSREIDRVIDRWVGLDIHDRFDRSREIDRVIETSISRFTVGFDRLSE